MCDRYRDGKCISRYCHYLSAGGTCLNPKMKPKPTNADRIRGMTDEELANELTRNPSIPCRMCEYWDYKLSLCRAWTGDFTCTTRYAEALTLDWLKAGTEGTP
jgi:hypothetical protein